ncbi:hypothetical protein HYALB_00013654 [Hymenoscyphus albidus]|uniref:Filamentation protein-like protein n=1 Tax=Hymenoscyphus albidus TaxID=595503 RepID=A0A9N9LV82_9HELO|nr:hypothetical protein HYALB_00013654 [Hymenoscyphus albidus]
MSVRDPSKAGLYIHQLDEARCHGNWATVPELVRKIKKHAPNRTCLALTAEAELVAHEASLIRPTSRPGTANTASTARPPSSEPAPAPNLSEYIPLLQNAIENEHTFVEDEFQAQVCLGWIHWLLNDPTLAAQVLPKSIEQEFSQLDGTNKESAEWTRVCALKASYLKGTAQVRTGAVAEALVTFETALPILSSVSSLSGPGKHGRELWSWSELYLTGFCMLSSHAIKNKVSSLLEAETLSAFRAWGNFWDTQTPAPTGGRAFQAEVPRRRVWREYYITLSDLLRQDLPFPTTSLTIAHAEPSTRLRQRAEIKRVEAKYETLLLAEVHFPKADQASEEVESFVEIVMENWRILCGSNWKEYDLGEGGSEDVSRGVLDILYRAATKTFHSTAILRHLFTVHLAIAEFDLALKAFDTYMEIVKKAKAREAKTGESEHGLDNDETVLRTVSECIRALCRYGSRQGAEKAKDLGQYLEEWMESHRSTEPKTQNRRTPGHEHLTNTGSYVDPRVFAMVWRSIGVSQAQWARMTFDASSRSETQINAMKSFRKSLSLEYQSSSDVETLFALGILLAERRELGPAIDVVKAALLPRPSATPIPTHESGPHAVAFARERKLIPLWHLMALLLSARQEFITATRSCEGAFEQFQDPKFLFGDEYLDGSFRSEHLKEYEKSLDVGAVDDMDDFEREGILEVKMTQLALIEVLEGPDIAVNASDELLSLYTRLFGDPQKDQPQELLSAAPPKTSAGTIRTIRGSIFGRTGRSLRKSIPPAAPGSTTQETREKSSPERPQTSRSTIAPTIHVTGENGTAKSRRDSLRNPHHQEKLQKRNDSTSRKRGTSLRNRSSSASKARNTSSARNSRNAGTEVDSENYFIPMDQNRDSWLPEDQEGEIGVAVIPDSSLPSNVLPPKSQNMSQVDPSLKPSVQDNRLPKISPLSSSTGPATKFPKEQQKRRRTAILVKVWLLISGFYRRASMFEDSRGAIQEAQKLVEGVEEEVSRDTTGAVSLQYAGWGGGKSVGELWGDVFAERGFLAISEALPYLALQHFESALTNFADHPSAIVGLSNILLDIYTEDLLPLPAIPPLVQPHDTQTPSASTLTELATNLNIHSTRPPTTKQSSILPNAPIGPLGLPSVKPVSKATDFQASTSTPDSPNSVSGSRETSAMFLDRLAARDRAYGLLSGLTKLGSGWNYSEAWFALARAYEEGGQPDKAREVLWWCVDLEEGRGVRGWQAIGSGGYVL